MENMNDKEMDKIVLESILDIANLNVLERKFNEYCDKYLAKEGNSCENCMFHFCKSQEDCKAMYLLRALEEMNSKIE